MRNSVELEQVKHRNISKMNQQQQQQQHHHHHQQHHQQQHQQRHHQQQQPQQQSTVACLGTTLELDCNHQQSLLVFDFATFGRNNTSAATRCGVPFNRNCELDVHFRLNRACAGRSYCTVPVNSKIFGDPCGFGEFLTVGYNCVSAERIQSHCNKHESSHSHYPEPSPLSSIHSSSSSSSSKLNPYLSASPFTFLPPSLSSSSSFFHNLSRNAYYVPVKMANGLSPVSSSSSSASFATHIGYVSSPNYPKKYHAGIDCTWLLVAKPWQSLRIVVSDFELAVKLNGHCQDRLTIRSTGGEVKFEECGPIGKQILLMQDNQALVTLTTSQRSHAGRGFLLHYEALGPSCQELDERKNLRIVYFHEPTASDSNSLSANISCSKGFKLNRQNTSRNWKDTGHELTSSVMKLRCHGNRWNEDGGFDCVGESKAFGHDLPAASNPIFRIGHVTTIHYVLTLMTSSLVLALMFVVVCLIYKRRLHERPIFLKRPSTSSLNPREKSQNFKRTFSGEEASCLCHQDLLDRCHDPDYKRRFCSGDHSRCFIYGDNKCESKYQMECTSLTSGFTDVLSQDSQSKVFATTSFRASLPTAASRVMSNNKPDLMLTCLPIPALRLLTKQNDTDSIQAVQNSMHGVTYRCHKYPSRYSSLTLSTSPQLPSAPATKQITSQQTMEPPNSSAMMLFDTKSSLCQFCHVTKS